MDYFYYQGPFNREDLDGKVKFDNHYDDIHLNLQHYSRRIDAFGTDFLAGRHEDRADFVRKAGQWDGYDYDRAVQRFKSDSEVRAKIMMNNADSVAKLALALAAPVLAAKYPSPTKEAL
jgi:hypothetical protein